MKLDLQLLTPQLTGMAEIARAAEDLGFAGLWVSETRSDPFLPLALAAEHSRELTLGTAIALAFTRSPTTLAYLAWDLARFSGGRFILGLGPQVRAHVERRFGAQWSQPVRRLQETVEAVRAVWTCWQTGRPLHYEGEFFKLDLMTPFFSTGPLEVPPPPIFLSAVNERMLHLAGQVADGVLLHALHTRRYLTDFAWPRIEAGLRSSGRSRTDFSVATSVFVVPSDDRRPASHFENYARQQLAFYLSTPAYRVVQELHGWREVAFKLSKMARRGQWEDMPALIDDNILAEFALAGTWAELPRLAQARFSTMVDRLSFYLPFIPGQDEARWRAAVAAFA